MKKLFTHLWKILSAPNSFSYADYMTTQYPRK